MPKLGCISLALVLCSLTARIAEAGDEPPLRADGVALPYLRSVHARVHPLWAETFLPMAAAQHTKDHALNQSSRRVELAVVLSADGTLYDVRVVKSSGAGEFDAAASDVLHTAGRFVPAPEALRSDDGKVHLAWAFARDDRRCSELSLTRREVPLAEAVRLLVERGRDDEAVARLQAATDDERAATMDAFAQAWLYRMERDAALRVPIAAAYARAGEARGGDTLRRAVDVTAAGALTAVRGDDDDTARGLAALEVPICPLVRASLARRPRHATTAAAELDDEGFATLLRKQEVRARVLPWLAHGASEACLALALAVAKDRSAGNGDRALAITALGRSAGPEVEAALRALANDSDVQIRALAIRAQARPGAGRGAVFRLTPLLRDRSPVLRAAAATALVRIAGEDALPQLFLVYREKDPGIFVALAGELANLSGSASAEMLGRFLKKDSRPVRVAAARALASRRDEHAAKLRAGLAASDDAGLQLLAGTALGKDRRMLAVRAAALDELAPSCAALLRGNARLVAADWLLARFGETAPRERASLLGEWIVTRGEHP